MYRKQRKSILHKKTLYFDKFRGINYGIPLCLLMLGSTGLLMLFSISGGEFNQTVMNHFLRLIVGFIFLLVALYKYSENCLSPFFVKCRFLR